MAELQVNHTISLDVAEPNWSDRLYVVQGTDNEVIIQVRDLGAPVDLTDVEKVLLISRPARRGAFPVFSEGTVTDADGGVVVVNLNRAAIEHTGVVESQLKMYGAQRRHISTTEFETEVERSTDDTVPSPNDYSFVEETLESAKVATADAEEAADAANTSRSQLTGQVGQAIQTLNADKEEALGEISRVSAANETHYGGTFATVAERDAAYPDPYHGLTVTIADETAGLSTSYRYIDATVDDTVSESGWVVTDHTNNPLAINQLSQQLADTVSVPRYTYNASQSYDILMAQMREEVFREKNIVLNRDNPQTYFEVSRRINPTGGDITIRIEADYNGNITASNQQMDSATWSNSSNMSAPTMISPGVWEKKISVSSLSKPFVGFGMRILPSEPSTTYAIITKMSMVQDGVELVGDDIFRYLAGLQGSVPGSQINADLGYRGYLSPVSNSRVNAPKIVYVSPNGLSNGLGSNPYKAVSWEYFADTFYPAYKDRTDFVIIESGYYRVKNRTQLLKITTEQKITFICPNGKAVFDCGEEKPTSQWTAINGSDFISFPYDPANHWNASVKSGAASPMVTLLESDSKTRIKLTRVNSQAESLNTDGSYFYDFAGKTFYVNWKGGVSYYLSVPELQSGFRIENKDAVVNFVNIEVKAAETSAYFVIPTSYGKGKISWYNCAGASSGTGDDFKIQYIDTDMVNCRSSMSGNDGFNFHYEGVSNLVNCESWGAFNDGMSHHENTKGYVWNFRALHNGTSASTPAFGAYVYHENCYSEDNGFDNVRSYSGGFAVLGGNGYEKTTAIYVNCKSVNDERGFAGDIQSNSGGNRAEIVVHNSEVVNPSIVGYASSNGVQIKSIFTGGVKTTSGNGISFIG